MVCREVKPRGDDEKREGERHEEEEQEMGKHEERERCKDVQGGDRPAGGSWRLAAEALSVENTWLILNFISRRR